MNKSFEDQWKDALGDASQTPPPEIWDRVEAELDKRKKRFILWKNPLGKNTLLLSGVAAAVALVLGTTLFVVNTPTPHMPMTEQHLPTNVEERAEAPAEVRSRVAAQEPMPKSQIQATVAVAADKELDLALSSSSTPSEGIARGTVSLTPIAPSQYQPVLFTASYPVIKREVPMPSERPSTRKKMQIGILAANAPFNPNFSAPGFQQQALAASQNSDILMPFEKGPHGDGGSYLSNSSRNDPYSLFRQGQSIGIGISTIIPLTDKLSLESGLRFSKSTSTHISNVYSLNTENGQADSYSFTNHLHTPSNRSETLISVSETSRYTYQFLSVPVLLNYPIYALGKLQVNAVGGVSTEFLLGGKVNQEQRSKEVHFNSGNSNFKSVNLAGAAGLRASYPITASLNINLGGNYQHFLTSALSKESQASFKPSMLGIHLGISVRH